MENIFRVINYDGDIEISIYKKANAVFKTNEYKETEDICIEKETINIFNLLKENQELKNIINQIGFEPDEIAFLQQENQELKLELSGYRQAILEDKAMLGLKEENAELKKQLEEKENIACNWKDSCLENAGKIEKLENQQKEFIEYMNKTIEELECDDVGDEEMKGYLIQRIDTFKEILSKYKEIIGVSDENNKQ